MSRKIVVRKATSDDILNIASITGEAFRKYAKDLGQPENVKALNEKESDILSDIRNKNVFVGTLDGEMVGSIRFEIIGQCAYISRFAVTLIAQGCGMGRALINAVKQECRALGLKAILLHTSSRMASLVRFYYGQGFFVYSTAMDRGYVRALLVFDIEDNDLDMEAIAGDR